MASMLAFLVRGVIAREQSDRDEDGEDEGRARSRKADEVDFGEIYTIGIPISKACEI